MFEQQEGHILDILYSQQKLLSQLHSKIDQLHRKCDRLEEKICILRKESLADCWKTIDKFDTFLYPPDMLIRCPLCQKEAEKASFKTEISYCRFGGGRLERFHCSNCGAIFGPLKMLSMTQQELAAEYTRHYALFSEGDSSFFEHAAFHQIDRGKDKIYLNWGGGCWSPTLNQLRAEGYTVYNYEPFSCHNKDSFLISDPEHLKTMRFDGIFSNNLLEHLPDPVGEILFMKTLLKNRDSLMLHSTPCFEYAYEYTRFHLIFFTGRALEYLANKTNFSVRKFPKTTQGNNFSIMALFQQR